MKLTQTNRQHLINLLRENLEVATLSKKLLKASSTELWINCDKDDPETNALFKHMKRVFTLAQEAKKKEKKLVELITKLKRNKV